MKKKLLILVLMLSINNLQAQQLLTCFSLTEEELQILACLQDSYIQNKLFYKNFSKAELVCSLDILSKAIQSLKKQNLPKNRKRLKLFLTVLALSPLIGAICFVAPVGKTLYTLYIQFKLGKFKNIHLSLSVIEKLSSKIISKKEKRYLKRFSFENLCIDYIDDFRLTQLIDPITGRSMLMNQKEKVQYTIANLSSVEKEKIRYLALRSAVINFKLQVIGLTCLIIIALAIGTLLFIDFFDKISKCDAKIQEEIKLNKEIYNFLKKEQERHQY